MRARLSTGEIAERYLSGASLAQIARESGVSRQAIQQRLATAGVWMPAKPLSLDQEAIERDFYDGASVSSLAEKHNCSPGTIRGRLRQWGLLSPPTRRGRGGREGDLGEAVSRYADGQTVTTIAAAMGLSRARVSAALKGRGVEIVHGKKQGRPPRAIEIEREEAREWCRFLEREEGGEVLKRLLALLSA